MTSNQHVKIALDWTPNTNHTGLYVARAHGLFNAQGLTVEFVSPAIDQYKTTPAARLVSGECLLAITPKETVISYKVSGRYPTLWVVIPSHPARVVVGRSDDFPRCPSFGHTPDLVMLYTTICLRVYTSCLLIYPSDLLFSL
jgi:hypothetical protein